MLFASSASNDCECTNTPPLTTHGLPRTCDTTHRTVRQAAPERARGVPPKRARRRHTAGALWGRLADGTVGCVACAQ